MHDLEIFKGTTNGLNVTFSIDGEDYTMKVADKLIFNLKLKMHYIYESIIMM